MATERLTPGAPVRLAVSDPWAFETEAGTNVLLGRVRAVEATAVVIALDVPVSYAGAVFDAARATARYGGDHAADAGTRAIVCNVTLLGSGDPARLIATLNVERPAARTVATIRIRRLPPRLLTRRRRYEVQLCPDPSGAPEWTRVTSTPVTLIDRHVGVGDAWSAVHAADAAWDGRHGEWIAFPPPGYGPTP